jgi:cytochrome P450
MPEDTLKSLAELRRAGPVCEAGPGVHLVVRHAEAAEVLRDHRTFSSVIADRGTEQRFVHEMDPPEHARLRSLFLFTGVAREVVRRVRPRIRGIWRDLAGALAARDRAELVEEFVRPGVRASFGEVAGIAAPDRDRIYGWISEMREDASSSPPGGYGRASRNASEAFEAYILEQTGVRRRAESPPDDVLTRLLFVEDREGDGLSENEIVMLMRLLCQAGIGSTSRSLGNLLFELIRVPDRYRRVRQDKTLVAVAVEESLRHDPPGTTLERVCVRDTTLGAARIRRGDVVVVNLTSANRDEAVYSDSETFDLDRARLTEHLSFGRGRHRCVGAPLARLVLEAGLVSFLDRIPGPRLETGFIFESESFGMWGPRALGVEIAAG